MIRLLRLTLLVLPFLVAIPASAATLIDEDFEGYSGNTHCLDGNPFSKEAPLCNPGDGNASPWVGAGFKHYTAQDVSDFTGESMFLAPDPAESDNLGVVIQGPGTGYKKWNATQQLAYNGEVVETKLNRLIGSVDPAVTPVLVATFRLKFLHLDDEDNGLGHDVHHQYVSFGLHESVNDFEGGLRALGDGSWIHGNESGTAEVPLTFRGGSPDFEKDRWYQVHLIYYLDDVGEHDEDTYDLYVRDSTGEDESTSRAEAWVLGQPMECTDCDPARFAIEARGSNVSILVDDILVTSETTPPFQVRYVADDATGSDDGTAATTPWTLSQANSSAVAGDILLMEAGTYPGQIAPAADGEDGRPIRYLGEAETTYPLHGATPLAPEVVVPTLKKWSVVGDSNFTKGNKVSESCIHLDGSSYVHIENLRCNAEFWQQRMFAFFQGASDNVVRHTSFVGTPGYAKADASITGGYDSDGDGIELHGGSAPVSGNRFEYNEINPAWGLRPSDIVSDCVDLDFPTAATTCDFLDRVWDAAVGWDPAYGHSIQMTPGANGIDRTLFYRNALLDGGHCTPTTDSGDTRSVYRENVVSNPDYRSCAGSGDSSLWDRNTLCYAGEGGDTAIRMLVVNVLAEDMIFRRNKVHSNGGTFRLYRKHQGGGVYGRPQNVKIYSNDFYGNGSRRHPNHADKPNQMPWGLTVDLSPNGSDIENVEIIGNVFRDNNDDGSTQVGLIDVEDEESELRIVQNLFAEGDPGSGGQDVVAWVEGSTTTEMDIGDFQSESVSTFVANVNQAPTQSNLEDKILLLTFVTDVTGAEVEVDDAGFFFDGYEGLAAPDELQFDSSSDTYQVLDVDMATNTLTLDRAPPGSSFRVLLAHSGSGMDIGATEYGSSAPTPPDCRVDDSAGPKVDEVPDGEDVGLGFCDDGRDNDGDGDIDCNDSTCAAAVACQ